MRGRSCGIVVIEIYHERLNKLMQKLSPPHRFCPVRASSLHKYTQADQTNGPWKRCVAVKKARRLYFICLQELTNEGNSFQLPPASL